MSGRPHGRRAGKIVESGNVFQIFENPLHPYTQGLLKSVLSIDEFKKELVTIEGTVPELINPPLGCRFHPRCEYYSKRCSDASPAITKVSDGHDVACWKYTNGG